MGPTVTTPRLTHALARVSRSTDPDRAVAFEAMSQVSRETTGVAPYAWRRRQAFLIGRLRTTRRQPAGADPVVTQTLASELPARLNDITLKQKFVPGMRPVTS